MARHSWSRGVAQHSWSRGVAQLSWSGGVSWPSWSRGMARPSWSNFKSKAPSRVVEMPLLLFQHFQLIQAHILPLSSLDVHFYIVSLLVCVHHMTVLNEPFAFLRPCFYFLASSFWRAQQRLVMVSSCAGAVVSFIFGYNRPLYAFILHQSHKACEPMNWISVFLQDNL